MYDACQERNKHEYVDLILSHFIRIMMEDESVNIRREIISLIDFNEKSMPFVVIKTQDKHSKVR